jgi:glycosyltransferase involved in cell wall biosynthesis
VAIALTGGDVIVTRPDYRKRTPSWYRALLIHKRLEHIPIGSSIPRAELSPVDRQAVRARYGPPGKTLLAFFGFPYEHKGIDDLLAILDPRTQHLLLIGALSQRDSYQRELGHRLGGPEFAAAVTVTGFLPAEEVARALAAVDAVVLPFRKGGGVSNSSLKAAMLQGTFVLTTSTDRRGFDESTNVYYTRPGDRDEMARALAAHVGSRPPLTDTAGSVPAWTEIAQRHRSFYQRHLRRGGATGTE